MKKKMKKILVVLLITLAACATPKKCCSQNQLVICDSLSWTQYPANGLSISLDTTNATMSPIDSVVVQWSVCDNQICYSGTGMADNFPFVNMSDTLKVCISTEFYYVQQFNQIIEYCYTCDSIVYNGNDWVSIYDNNTVSIEELIIERFNDNKIYDVYGRELPTAPIGQIYIQNRKKYIKINN